ncbi:MAG: lysophospholipid acyltransferase family protein [Candidatus Pacebacteria bacterium]|nr:lysophospholipid acyltransferase family protein [Candidatus Paceibacterota bacterium]
MANKSYQAHHLLSRDVSWGKIKTEKVIITKPPFPFRRFFFNLIYWPIRASFSFFTHMKISSKENLSELRGPLIIASNHLSFLDSFIIASAFPFGPKIYPIRYACWFRYFYFPVLTPFLWLLGTFPVRKGIGLEKSLKVAVNILKKGGVVGIFPEGKRAKIGHKPKGRRGAAYLAFTTKTRILPVKIEEKSHISLINFFTRKYKIRVRFGKVFNVPYHKISRPEDLNDLADFIMERIREI